MDEVPSVPVLCFLLGCDLKVSNHRFSHSKILFVGLDLHHPCVDCFPLSLLYEKGTNRGQILVFSRHLGMCDSDKQINFKWVTGIWEVLPFECLGFWVIGNYSKFCGCLITKLGQRLHRQGHDHVEVLGGVRMERNEGKGRFFPSIIIIVVRNWIKILSAALEIFADAVLRHI